MNTKLFLIGSIFLFSSFCFTASGDEEYNIPSAAADIFAAFDSPEDIPMDEIHLAARKGDFTKVEELLQEGVKANTKVKLDWTAAHFAASKGLVYIYGLDAYIYNLKTSESYAAHGIHKGILGLLAMSNADLNAPDKEGRRPLHLAAFVVDPEITEVLVELGAEINATDNKGRTALHWVVSDTLKTINKDISNKEKKIETLKVLLNKNADPNQPDNLGRTAVHEAAAYGYMEEIKLIKKLKPKKFKDAINATDKAGNTPLHLAIYNRRIDMSEWLLENGADPNIQNKNGETAFHSVFEMRRSISDNSDTNKIILRATKLFIKFKADPNIKEYKIGFTPFHYAAISYINNIESLKVLIKNGAYFHINDRWIDSVKDKKIIKFLRTVEPFLNHPELLEHLGLLESGSLIKNKIKAPFWQVLKNTEMIFSKEKRQEHGNNKKLAELLNSKNAAGILLYKNIILRGHVEAAKIILKNGADLNTLDENGNNLLHLAILTRTSNLVEIVTLLFKFNVNPNIINKEGKTFLDLVDDYGKSYKELEKILEEKDLKSDFDKDYKKEHQALLKISKKARALRAKDLKQHTFSKQVTKSKTSASKCASAIN